MRPLWERTLTWTVANHLHLNGVGYDQAYSTAALVVRGLDRRYGLTTEMARFSPAVPADVDDADKSSPRYLSKVADFWGRIGGGGKAERNRLLQLALASMLRSSRPEIDAAAVLAGESRATIEPYFGRLGVAFEEGTWGLRGLGALREEMAATGSAEILAAYDRLVTASRERKAVLEVFQTWARNLGWYDGRIDGIWGDKTERAFVRAVPMAAGRLSVMGDVVPLRGVFTDAPTTTAADARGFALLITRDIWLTAHPDKIVTPAVPEPLPGGDAGTISVTYPKTETIAPTPGGGSQITVSYPKQDGSGATERAAVTLPPATEITAVITPVAPGWRPTRTQMVGGALVVTGLLMVGGAWWWSRHRDQAAKAA